MEKGGGVTEFRGWIWCGEQCVDSDRGCWLCSIISYQWLIPGRSISCVCICKSVEEYSIASFVLILLHLLRAISIFGVKIWGHWQVYIHVTIRSCVCTFVSVYFQIYQRSVWATAVCWWWRVTMWRWAAMDPDRRCLKWTGLSAACIPSTHTWSDTHRYGQK